MSKRSIWIVAAGSVASIVTIITIGTVHSAPFVLSYQYSGLPFAAAVVFVIAIYDQKIDPRRRFAVRYVLAALVLAVGVPFSLLVAGLCAKFGSSFVLAGLAAAASWGAFLTASLSIMASRWKISWLILAITLLMVVYIAVHGINETTRHIWQVSVFVPLLIFAEQFVSAIFLARSIERRTN
jgi:hypothetical protein